jgi:LysM repeat protein
MKMTMKPKPRKRLKATAQRAVAAAQDDYFDDEPNMRLSRAFEVVLILHVIAVGGIFLFNQLKRGQGASPAASASSAQDTPVRTPDNPSTVVRIHYLRTGESVTDVAASYGVAVSDILTASGLKSAEGVKAGTELRVPPRSASSPVPLDVRRLVDQPRTPTTELVKAPQPAEAAKKKPIPADVVRSIVAAPAKTPETKKASAEEAGTKTYVVMKGDNPVSIAKHHGISYERLLQANGIEDPRKLQIGQKLVIPAKN